MQTATLNVLGMSCNHCVNSIEGALGILIGVNSAKVKLAENQVSVTYEESQVDIEKVKEMIEDQGYEVA